MVTQKSGKEEVTCQWIRNDTGKECGSTMKLESFFRHMLSIHTELFMKPCTGCWKRFRKDTLDRHTDKCLEMMKQ